VPPTDPQQPPESREKLLLAARECLLSHGFSGCSVKKIAALAGVNHGLVHHYFGSKENLMTEVLKSEVFGTLDRMFKAIGQQQGFISMEHMFTRTDLTKVIIEMIQLAPQMPRIQEMLVPLFESFESRVNEVLKCENPLTAKLLHTGVAGMMLRRRVDPTLPVQDMMRHLLKSLAQTDPAVWKVLAQMEASHPKSNVTP